mgnify:CR=1 FL=1
MKKFLIVIFLIGVLGSLFLYIDPLGWRPYRDHSLTDLKLLLKVYEQRLSAYEAEHERLSLAPVDTRVIGAERKRAQELLHLTDMIQATRYSTNHLRKEIALKETLRAYRLGFLPPHVLPLILSALSLCLLLLPALRERLFGPYSLLEFGGRQELPAKEEYISEGDLPRKIQTGFSSRKEAQHWLMSDPGLFCEYCGAKMRIASPGTLQQITFYKKVPAGVKDQRVILGTYWYARPPSLLTCKKCGRELRR